MQDCIEVHLKDLESKRDQRRERRNKVNISEEKCISKSQHKLINTIYMNYQYHSSTCLKDGPRQINCKIRLLIAPTAQRILLWNSSNIIIIGLEGKLI